MNINRCSEFSQVLTPEDGAIFPKRQAIRLRVNTFNCSISIVHALGHLVLISKRRNQLSLSLWFESQDISIPVTG